MKLKEYEKIAIFDLNSHEEQTHIDDCLPTQGTYTSRNWF